MKTSLIILTGASTASAGWLHRLCCGGFSDGPHTTTTVASTFGAGNSAPTTTNLDMDEIYPASPDYWEPTTLLTSVVPTKTADVELIPVDQDLDLESADVESITTGQDLNIETADFESITTGQDLNIETADVEPIAMSQGVVEIDPTTDAGIAVSPTEVPKSDYPGSAGTPLLENVDSILKDSSLTKLEEEEAKAIQEAEDLAMDAGPEEFVQLIDSFQQKAAFIQEMIERQGQATNQVSDDGEAGPGTSDETTDSLVSQLVAVDVVTAVLMIRFSELNAIEVPSQEANEDEEDDMFYSFMAEDAFPIDEEPGSKLVEIGKPSSSTPESINRDKISLMVVILQNQRMMAKQQLSISSDSENEEDGVGLSAPTETNNADGSFYK
ncbi:hypothetical protein Cpir12675_005364 [Ceratocystis pirilliformis]|uniref:Uncharacterized protein n=1 Tax=Ceratocystis pirilliformis TaxID=259994 RepID=A0ABR3YRH1_9PEZI